MKIPRWLLILMAIAVISCVLIVGLSVSGVMYLGGKIDDGINSLKATMTVVSGTIIAATNSPIQIPAGPTGGSVSSGETPIFGGTPVFGGAVPTVFISGTAQLPPQQTAVAGMTQTGMALATAYSNMDVTMKAGADEAKTSAAYYNMTSTARAAKK